MATAQADASKTDLDDMLLGDLAGKLGTEWQRLAVIIGLTTAKLDAIKANNPFSMVNQVMEMLITWRRMRGKDDDTVSILTEGLERVGRTDLAEEILASRSSKARGSSTFDIRAIRAELVEHYLNTTCKVATHPLFPAWVRDMGGIYVDLNLIDESTQPGGQPPSSASSSSKHSLQGSVDHGQIKKVCLRSHGDLVGLDGPGKYRVLLKGRPGSGKSTVVKKVTYDWSSERELEDKTPESEEPTMSDDKEVSKSCSPFSKFTLLFPLKLNQMANDTHIVNGIFNQILPRDTKVSKVKLKNFIEDHQEEVLFLLDGLDELPASIFETSEVGNHLKDVLTGRALRHCCVIVTSRYHRANQLLKCYPHFAQVETTGFGSKERDEYVKRYFTSAQDQAQLVTEMESSVTLQRLGEIPLLLLMMCLVWATESTLPKRLTELYEHVVRILLLHQTTKFGVSLPNQSDLPYQLMKKLGRVALDGLLHNGGEKLVFSADDFSSEDIAKGCDIGLLIQDSMPTGSKVQSVITFLHKSFQELCAASYLAELVKENCKQFKKYLSNITVDKVGNMEYLLRFCSGKSTKAAKLIIRHVKKLQKVNVSFDKAQSQRLKLIIAFEAGSSKLISLLSDVTSFSHLKGEDLLAAHFFLQNVRGLPSVRKLSVECASSAEMGLVMSMLRQTPNVQDLICHKGPDTHMEEASTQVPRLKKLVTVYFFDSPASRSPGQSSSLVPRFISQQSNLVNIHLIGIGMHGWVASLRPHMRVVESLSLSKCGLLSEDVHALCTILSSSSNLRVLTLSGNRINGSLLAMVPIVPFLHRLDLSNCGILESDAESLACLLAAASKLKFLSLSNNKMQGQLSILDPVVPHLNMLHLDYCSLVDSDVESLSVLLSSAKNMKRLHLLHNDFSNIENIKYTVCMKALSNMYLLLSYDVFGLTSGF